MTGRAANRAPQPQVMAPASARQNDYFVPRDGIDREVITSDICRYLGNDALVRPGTYEVGASFALFWKSLAVSHSPAVARRTRHSGLLHHRIPKSDLGKSRVRDRARHRTRQPLGNLRTRRHLTLNRP